MTCPRPAISKWRWRRALADHERTVTLMGQSTRPRLSGVTRFAPKSTCLHDGHQQGRSVRRTDLSNGLETGLLVTANRTGILRIWVSLNRGDAGVGEQLLGEGIDHLAAQPLTKSGAVTEELVNSKYSKINFVLPPTFAAPNRHVGLDESERFSIKVRDIRFDVRRTHHSWTVFPPDAFQIRGDIATAPPLDNERPMQPVSRSEE